jgi:hypothetical protein
VNLSKRKQTDVEGPEEDTADHMFNNCIVAAARARELPEGWQSGKQIKRFPGFGGFLDDIRAGGAPSREPEQRAPGTLPGLVMDDLLNLDTYGTAAMQSHQISGISNQRSDHDPQGAPTDEGRVLSSVGKLRGFEG